MASGSSRTQLRLSGVAERGAAIASRNTSTASPSTWRSWYSALLMSTHIFSVASGTGDDASGCERKRCKLRSRYPARRSARRCIGATVGVKDIFHVDGFVTRAGTNLPPQLFAGR